MSALRSPRELKQSAIPGGWTRISAFRALGFPEPTSSVRQCSWCLLERHMAIQALVCSSIQYRPPLAGACRKPVGEISRRRLCPIAESRLFTVAGWNSSVQLSALPSSFLAWPLLPSAEVTTVWHQRKTIVLAFPASGVQGATVFSSIVRFFVLLCLCIGHSLFSFCG